MDCPSCLLNAFSQYLLRNGHLIITSFFTKEISSAMDYLTCWLQPFSDPSGHALPEENFRNTVNLFYTESQLFFSPMQVSGNQDAESITIITLRIIHVTHFGKWEVWLSYENPWSLMLKLNWQRDSGSVPHSHVKSPYLQEAANPIKISHWYVSFPQFCCHVVTGYIRFEDISLNANIHALSMPG